MSDEKENYREGGDDTGDEELKVVPTTAFLVVMLPSGVVDLVTNLPGFTVQRAPTVQDIRNMTRIVSDDAQARILATKASEGIARSLSGIVSSLGGQRPQNLANMMPGVPPGMVSPMTKGPRPVSSGITPDLSKKGKKGDA